MWIVRGLSEWRDNLGVLALACSPLYFAISTPRSSKKRKTLVMLFCSPTSLFRDVSFLEFAHDAFVNDGGESGAAWCWWLRAMSLMFVFLCFFL